MSLPFSHFPLRTWSSIRIFPFYRRTLCDQARSCIHHNVATEFDELDFSFESGHDLDDRKTRTCIVPKPVANPCFTGKFRNLTATRLKLALPG